MKKKYTHVTIDRRKWSRGALAGNALLIDRFFVNRLFPSSRVPAPKVSKMCCLGFACLALGAKKKDITGITMPGATNLDLPGLITEHGGDTEFSKSASQINDGGDLTDKEREKQLKALARQNGFIFKFVN